MAQAQNAAYGAVQDEAARREALASSAAASGSATGQAIAHDSGKEEERLKGADKRPTPEGAPKGGDFGEGTPAKPEGLQKEPAAFATNGTIPANMVSSPGGLVPISAVAEGDQEEALERTLNSSKYLRNNGELKESDLEALNGPDIRAVGVQRGYKMPEMGGSQTMRRVFLQQQDEDKNLERAKPAVKK